MTAGDVGRVPTLAGELHHAAGRFVPAGVVGVACANNGSRVAGGWGGWGWISTSGVYAMGRSPRNTGSLYGARAAVAAVPDRPMVLISSRRPVLELSRVEGGGTFAGVSVALIPAGMGPRLHHLAVWLAARGREAFPPDPGGDAVTFRQIIAADDPGTAVRQAIAADAGALHTDTVHQVIGLDFTVRRALDDLPPGAVAVAVDGSASADRGGWGWMATTGAYGLGSCPADSGAAEMQAALEALRAVPDRPLALYADSMAVVDLVNRRQDGVFAGVQARWIPGHSGHPLHTAADWLAFLGRERHAADPDGDVWMLRRIAAAARPEQAVQRAKTAYLRTPGAGP